MTVISISMPYIGYVLSVNGYQVVGRGGRKTFKIKRQTEIWMGILTEKVQKLKPQTLGLPVIVKLEGHFTDERYPDLHNLHKVIGDAIKVGLNIDDKYFQFEDGESLTGYSDPTIEITILVGN